MSRTSAGRHEVPRSLTRWPWRPPPAPPRPEAFSGRVVLLASEGRALPQDAVDLAVRLARTSGAEVHVLSIARIWGSALGLPHPGLMPNRREWQAQRDRVAEAVTRLQGRDVPATGQVVSGRNAARRILAEARRRGADAIVMAADPPRHWLLAGMIWSQEPHRVRRLARLPVYLVGAGSDGTPASIRSAGRKSA